mgnify:CR=1 FL=1
MAIEKHIKINVDTKGAVKSFDKLGDTIQEQKDITIEFEKELHRLEQQLLSTSKGNLAQQKRTKDRIVDLKGALKDQRLSLKSLNNERRKAVKVTDINTKSLSENYGVVQLLDQVTGGLASQVRSVVDANRLFNFSLKGTRAALIATGVGAFVVALGLIVAYWDEISDAIKGTTENLQVQLDLTKAIQSNLDLQVKNIEKQLALGELQGKTNEALEQQKIALLERLQQQNDAEQLLLEKQIARLKGTATEVSLWEAITGNIQFALFGAQGLADAATKLSGERLTAIKALEDQLLAAQGVAIDLETTLFKIANPEGEDGDKLPEAQEIGDGLNLEDTATLESKKLLNELLSEEDIKLQESQSLRDARRLKDIEIIANYEKYQAEQVKNAKIAIAGQTLNIIGMLAKEGSDLAKGIAASQATINTFLGVTSALSAPSTIPEPFGTILKFANAAAIGVSGAINVGKILATKPVTTSAPSGGAGGRAPAPPSFNLVSGTASNQISNSLQTQEPVRAIVVSRDVTSAQEANRNSENNSTL